MKIGNRTKENEKIKKSKEIIKKEQKRIKKEKKKMKKEKFQKKYNNLSNKFLKKNSSKNKTEEPKVPTIKEQIFSMIYFEIIGIVLCLLVFFILSGGKNFIKLYKDLNKLINVYDTIVSNYYGDLDKEALVDTAIESMLQSVGDNYTTYSDEESTNTFMENIGGSYEGIGCLVSMNEVGEIYVVSVFEEGPAQQAGLQENDIILKIDGQDYSDKTSQDMSDYVKNNTNSKIELVIKRNELEKEITIVRKEVEVPSVTSKIIEQNNQKIGYIKITIFSSVTTEQFKKHLTKLEKENIKGLIIDVRDNTGGYLSTVTDITNMFLKKGQIIYQLEDNKKTEKIKDTTKESRDYPIAVLVNAASASASEILAASIKESYKGYVVGTNTFGKGSVQKTKTLSDGSMIKYTIQKWLTPEGNWINEIGVTPTHFIEKTKDEEDNQLQKAIEIISQKLK